MSGRHPDWASGHTLAALRQARAQATAAPPPRRAGAGSPATPRPAPVPAAQDDDHRALLQALDGVAPLHTAPRAQLHKPPPAPIPKYAAERARAAREAAAERKAAHAHLPNWLPEDLQDVLPLPDTGRIDPQRPAKKRAAHRAAPAAVLASALLSDNHGQPDGEPASLFARMMAGVTPRKDDGRAELTKPLPAPIPRQRQQDDQAVLHESLAPLDLIDRLDAGIDASFLRPGIARRVLADLRRGRYSVQGELDLHGLTRESARAALAHFLTTSLRQGLRCVRVIHGKGLGSPGGHSILKQLSKGWLAQREEILAFCQARPTQGGDGALLVLLRGKRPDPRQYTP